MKMGFREIIFMLLLLATPLGAYFFLFEPRNEQIFQAQIEMQKKREKLKSLKIAHVHFSDLENEIKRLNNTVAAFEEKLPAKREVDVILKQVTDLVAAENLITKRIKPEKQISLAQFTALPIKMTLTGKFDDFYNFLLGFEKLQRVTRIPSWKIYKKSAGKDDKKDSMVADIEFRIFYENTNY